MSRRRRRAQYDSSPNYQAKCQELLRTAADVFKEKGFEGITLHEIAERFETDRASIYYYFASKTGLFQAFSTTSWLMFSMRTSRLPRASSSATTTQPESCAASSSNR
ncbi:TetR/AcrR family transcriptional regulator [Rhodococcus sp. NPDC057014]|uniref:TetR/AcrR family transcriptional regulator n=1 Tax=Rhodococcus sp. NPDC057014 TaxID=3346000 RepID=UPI0036318938